MRSEPVPQRPTLWGTYAHGRTCAKCGHVGLHLSDRLQEPERMRLPCPRCGTRQWHRITPEPARP